MASHVRHGRGFSVCHRVACVLWAVPAVCLVLAGGCTGDNVPAFLAGAARDGEQLPANHIRRARLDVNNADAVFAAYVQDADWATAELTNKWFAVTGVIHSISYDPPQAPSIVLVAGDDDTAVIECTFTEADRRQASRLSPGQMVLLAGKCLGKNEHVIMRECWFYAPPTNASQKTGFDASEQARMHMWTAADGEFITQGRYVKSDLTTVTIERLDGTRVSVPLEELSSADKTFIDGRSWQVSAH
ncbi:MAG: hypothetical protein GXY58_18120 [Planctomycetaceae bacterium]|nr:hypothetical protein [Planctomycetaceae bacterium]